jgi:hypothetical protein
MPKTAFPATIKLAITMNDFSRPRSSAPSMSANVRGLSKALSPIGRSCPVSCGHGRGATSSPSSIVRFKQYDSHPSASMATQGDPIAG